MSGKLDKSLDEILVNRRQGARRGSGRRTAAPKPAPAVGGVKKNTKAVKAAAKPVHNGRPRVTESKIMVSGLVSFLHALISMNDQLTNDSRPM